MKGPALLAQVTVAGGPDTAPVLDRYRHLAGSAGAFDEVFGTHEQFDHGTVRSQWSELASVLARSGRSTLDLLQNRVGRLVEDHGITYNTISGPGVSASATMRWELDVVPFILSADDWERLEAGMTQRSRLLDLILTDIYGRQSLIREGLLPPELVFGHPGYLRAAHGITVPGPHQLFFHAADVVRSSNGQFAVMSDRTQAPSGAGYALADRTVISRAVPELFEQTNPRQLSTFVRAMRLALIEAAPDSAENPLVVVLSPGVMSETAFDQSYLASVLGFPLVESADLVVRDGALWMRALGTLRRVDVVVRRVDDGYVDPLDLRPDSKLGVVGLVEVLRRGAVTVVNTIGSGILENPALMTMLPSLSRSLLGEELLLPSVETLWAGDSAALQHIEVNLPSMIVTSSGSGGSHIGNAISAAARENLIARMRAQPWAWSARSLPDLAHTPVGPAGHGQPGEAVVPGAVSLRLFDVAQRVGYTPMIGGLAQVLVTDPLREPMVSSAAKDIWVRPPARLTPADSTSGPTAPVREVLPRYSAARVDGVTSPRVLGDLFWLGRYAERAESMARILVTAGVRYQDFSTKPWLEAAPALPVLLDAVAAVSGAGSVFDAAGPRSGVVAEFRSLTLDSGRPGSLAQSIEGLLNASRAVRDQLSSNTWVVFSALDTALARLAAAPDLDEAELWETQSRVIGAMLAVSGLAAESMVRDPGWYLMDVGRRLERAVQTASLLAATVTTARLPAVETAIIESVLTMTESSVTYRRRTPGLIRLAAVAELLLFDAGNPRSLIYQLDRILDALRRLPGATRTSRPEQAVERMTTRLRRVDPGDLEVVEPSGSREVLADLLTSLRESLLETADLVTAAHLTLPGGTQPLWGGGSTLS